MIEILNYVKYKMSIYIKKQMNCEMRKKYIARIYKKCIGREMDWNNLVTYTEKMQYAKLLDISDLKVELTDKIMVREWIKERIGEEYLIPILGIYDKPEEINYDILPNKFVIKTNNASGTNIIVKDKEKLNKKEVAKKLNQWLKEDFSYVSCFEMHYSYIKPKILIEKYIETKNDDLQDYKFMCFNSKVYYCWVDVGRYKDHKRNIYNLDWELQPFNQYTYGNTSYEIKKPEKFDEMVEIASSLCRGFSHVRVDLYNVDGKIYFGEMTFTNGGGYEAIYPKEYDKVLGDLWNIEIEYNI